jgi:hypothetical protein
VGRRAVELGEGGGEAGGRPESTRSATWGTSGEMRWIILLVYQSRPKQHPTDGLGSDVLRSVAEPLEKATESLAWQGMTYNRSRNDFHVSGAVLLQVVVAYVLL